MTTAAAIRFLQTTLMHSGKKAYPVPTHGERGLRVSTREIVLVRRVVIVYCATVVQNIITCMSLSC